MSSSSGSGTLHPYVGTLAMQWTQPLCIAPEPYVKRKSYE